MHGMSTSNDNQLSEQYVQDAFHSYLKLSLAQAKAERLVDAALLTSAAGDVMITGPALALYFAALRSTTNPPSVSLPQRASAPGHSVDLSQDNCPAVFSRFFSVWAYNVALIQALAPESQHDLARIVCNLPPLNVPVDPSLAGIAAELRAVAIEISQRRSFQDRYAGDLQAAIDAGQSSGAPKMKATFVPPPLYDAGPSVETSDGQAGLPFRSPEKSSESSHLSPLPASPTSHAVPPRFTTPSPSRSPIRIRTPSPTILPDDAPAIDFIRETLYASLYDVLQSHSSLSGLLQSDPARAYFASVSLAVLNVSCTSITSTGSVIGVLRQELTMDDCPEELKVYMKELGAIGKTIHELEKQDMEEALRLAQAGEEVPKPRLEQVKELLERGVGSTVDRSQHRRRPGDGSVMTLANRIGALSLKLTKLRAFRERQEEVFKVLGDLRR